MHLNLRKFGPEERSAQLGQAYEALPDGHGATFISDRNERGLLALFQERYPGAFDWYPLEEGPEHWIVMIVKRPAGAPRTRQVLEFMETDHRRLRTMVDQVVTFAQEGNWKELGAHNAHLDTSLRKHIQMEEELLLPVIAARLASPRGPAAWLREEHIRILDLIHVLQESSQRATVGAVVGCNAIARQTEHINTVLLNHQGIEERILYAMTDLLLNQEERDELVRKCQAL